MIARYSLQPCNLLFLAAFCAALAAALPASSAASTAQPVAATQAFVQTLPDKLRTHVQLSFVSDSRFGFDWVPGTRPGVSLGELNDTQRDALRDVLRSVMSPAGAQAAEAIVIVEKALGEIEGNPGFRDPGRYWLTVFGEPSNGKIWGLRFEGHHLSANFTLNGDKVLSATPSFFGSNPETVPSGPHKGLRPIAAKESRAWALYDSLTPEQRERARSGGGLFGGFKTSSGTRTFDAGAPDGLPASAMTAPQREKLSALIDAYVSLAKEDFAARYRSEVVSGEAGTLYFHWRGAEKQGEAFFYRIQGRRLMIEHDAHDGALHVHSIWRDKDLDFGGAAYR